MEIQARGKTESSSILLKGLKINRSRKTCQVCVWVSVCVGRGAWVGAGAGGGRVELRDSNDKGDMGSFLRVL